MTNRIGKNNPFYGKHHSKEVRKMISISKMGEKNPWYGKKLPEKIKEKMSVAHKGEKNSFYGKKHSKETKALMSKLHKGIHFSEETKRKISESKKGEKHPLWKGGISFLPYSLDWTKTLKRSIRERDKYTCQICSSQQGDRAFDVHHIDYNKLNSNPDNLITLCRSCHMKTNSNREYWIKYFLLG
jgi:5-methylcytosine-specific restriction endonuclease McrA